MLFKGKATTEQVVFTTRCYDGSSVGWRMLVLQVLMYKKGRDAWNCFSSAVSYCWDILEVNKILCAKHGIFLTGYCVTCPVTTEDIPDLE